MLKPHDAFFKKLMSNPQNIKDFLINFLPDSLKKAIDFNSIKLIDTEKSNRKYKKYYLDLSVECRLKNKKTEIYIVFEHKSYPDKLTLIQILNYCTVIWENNLKDNKNLTPIIPLIFYHGKQEFDLPIKFIDYFEIDEEIKRYLLNFEVILFDLNKVGEEELFNISRNVYLMSGLLMMKHIFSDINKIKEVFRKVIKLDNESFLMVVEYFVMSKDIEEDKLNEILKEIGGEAMPSLAEKWMEQGFQKGIQKGKLEGLKEGIKNMYKELKLSSKEIARILKVPYEKVEEIIKSLDNS